MKYKTEICRNWEEFGKCKFQSTCSYAHGPHELLKKKHLPQNYKTKICIQFHTTQYCPYGSRCQFLHSQYDIFNKKTENQIANFSYQVKLEENTRLTKCRLDLLEEDPELKYVNIFSTRRLPIFSKISPHKSLQSGE